MTCGFSESANLITRRRNHPDPNGDRPGSRGSRSALPVGERPDADSTLTGSHTVAQPRGVGVVPFQGTRPSLHGLRGVRRGDPRLLGLTPAGWTLGAFESV